MCVRALVLLVGSLISRLLRWLVCGFLRRLTHFGDQGLDRFMVGVAGRAVDLLGPLEHDQRALLVHPEGARKVPALVVVDLVIGDLLIFWILSELGQERPLNL